MKRLLQTALVLGLVVGLTGVASAQGQQRQRGQGGGGGFGMGGGMSNSMLLGQKSVQEDLKLSEDQVKKVTEMGEKARSAFGSFQGLSREEIAKKMEEMRTESEKAVGEILKPEQVKRLKEIGLQVRQRQGMGGVLNDKDVQSALSLSDDQKQQIKALEEDAQKFRREVMQAGGGGGGGGGGFGRLSDEQRQKLTDFNKTQSEKFAKVLTDDQKAKLKQLAGAEFKGELQFGGGRRPGGGGR